MLEKSKCCYIEASTCQSEEEFEEEWLHHYMLGKISEKSGEGPEKFLYHYQKVLIVQLYIESLPFENLSLIYNISYEKAKHNDHCDSIIFSYGSFKCVS